MPKGQQPPPILLNQCSEESSDPQSSQKANISRSHSAPQQENQFTALRLGLKNKNSPKSPKKVPAPSPGANIPTLSDGVMLMSPDLPAVEVLSNQEPISEISPSKLANQSPSLSRDTSVTSLTSQEPKPDDVWQRREKFSAVGHSDGFDNSESSDQNQNGNGASSKTEVHTSRSERKPLPNGCSGNAYTQNLPENRVAVNGDKNTVTVPGTPDNYGTLLRNQSHRNPLRQARSEILPNEVQRKMSIADMKEKGVAKLEEELTKAQRALELKDEEVGELRGIRERLMKEVSDFTASLFEEVNSQLNEATLNEQHAKKQLQEANSKIEVLSAELTALKSLVLTSTPSSPNKHLHPQIDTSSANKKDKNGKPFWKTHRRSTSHHQYTKESREKAEAMETHSQLKEMDNNAYDEFTRWRLQPTVDFSCQFLNRVHHEDIQPCLNFKNTQLSKRLSESVKQNTLLIEPIPGDHSFPRKCMLSETHKLCNYKIKFEGEDEWYSISQMSRNRIAAVCDFYSYIRYISQGLVKSSDKDMFVEVVRLRHNMAQARLGLL